jgi:transposase, IS5 family
MCGDQAKTILEGAPDMSICDSGVESNVRSSIVSIKITSEHPLIQLCNALNWQKLSEMVLPDLKASTKKGQWWLGRKLRLRIHLAIYLLQQLFNKTDRQIEYDAKDNAAFQIFCGKFIVDKWHVPDHTKIEKFRSRLSPETQKQLANEIAASAVKLGFGDPSEIDIDSTVQEANMAYPADSGLLKKLGMMAGKAAAFLNKSVKQFIKTPLKVDVKKIGKKAREYFFLSKNATQELKSTKLMSLLNTVCSEIKSVICACTNLSTAYIKRIPWNQARRINQIRDAAEKYLKDVRQFILSGSMVPTKVLSFHLKEVACFTKGKPGKKYQFGRAFQLLRIKGNFLISGKCTSPQMPDKRSVETLITEHAATFEQATINSVSTDKGYFSRKNEKYLLKRGVSKIGIQRPGNIKKAHPKPLSAVDQEKLANRRSGIEPLIGHAKQKGQLGRSRMKSDKSAESSGYTAILGFNLRQFIRHQAGKMLPKTVSLNL